MSYQTVGNHTGVLFPAPAYVIAKARNPEGGEAFLDAYLAAGVQVGLAKFAGMLPLTGAARTKLRADPKAGTSVPTEAALADMYTVDFSIIDTARWRDAWSRAITK
jgi:ABC-type Fe3+ transport system substrate-binding protein